MTALPPSANVPGRETHLRPNVWPRAASLFSLQNAAVDGLPPVVGIDAERAHAPPESIPSCCLKWRPDIASESAVRVNRTKLQVQLMGTLMHSLAEMRKRPVPAGLPNVTELNERDRQRVTLVLLKVGALATVNAASTVPCLGVGDLVRKPKVTADTGSVWRDPLSICCLATRCHGSSHPRENCREGVPRQC